MKDLSLGLVHERLLVSRPPWRHRPVRGLVFRVWGLNLYPYRKGLGRLLAPRHEGSRVLGTKRLQGTLLNRNLIIFFVFHRGMVTLPPNIRGKCSTWPSERRWLRIDGLGCRV